MAREAVRVFLLLLPLVFCCFVFPGISQELTIITEEFPPFNFTKDGKLTGVTTEVVREIMRRQGLPDRILVLPWARGYKQLQTEPNVVLYTTARTQEREDLFRWVGPLYVFRLGFYARKDANVKLDSPEDAKSVRAIATYKDDFREQLLRSMGFDNLERSNNPHSNILKLISGRVDLWFFDNIGAPQVAGEAGVDPDSIEEVLAVKEDYSYIAFSKGTPEPVVKRWQETLDEMKADGTFWWITRKWLPSNAIMTDNDQRAMPSRIVTEDSSPSSYMKDGRVTGLSVEIVQEILRRVNHKGIIEIVPWVRGYELAVSQPDIALFSTTRLPQRENLFHWIGPLYTHNWGLYARKGSGVRVSSMQEAKQVARIGTYRGDAKMNYLEALGFTNLVPANQNLANVARLIRGDIDLWVSSDFNMPHLVREAGFEPERLAPAFSLAEVGNYIVFSRKASPHMVRLWEAVLDEMKDDGTYERLCRKYGYQP